MSGVLSDLAVVLVFILIGSFFAAAEIALVSLRDSQVRRLSEAGARGRRLAALAADPNRFLAAVQVGVTLAGFVSAGFGAAQIAPQVQPALQSLGLSEAVAGTIAFVGVTVFIAYISLVLGELVPKRLALQRAESVALALATPVDVLAGVSRPFIWLLSASTNGVVRLLGGDPEAGKDQITGEELRGMVASHEELSVEERELIDDVFSAGDRELREVMVPRTEVDFLDAALPLPDAVAVVVTQPHSRYPVVAGSTDEVVGFVHVRDLLSPREPEVVRHVGDLVREVLFLPGTKAILPALTEMRRLGQHLAVVVDEYGGTAGIVTMEDLVEELVGDIRDEYDEGTHPSATEPGSAVDVDGLLNLDDFAEMTGLTLPEGPYETAAGFVVARLGRLATVGSVVDVGSRSIEVLHLDGRRIARLRVLPAAADPADATDPADGAHRVDQAAEADPAHEAGSQPDRLTQ